MTIAKDGEGMSASVTWRLPLTVSDSMNGDWTPMRKMLDWWAKKGVELKDPEPPEETLSCCMRMDHDTLAAVEAEAERLTKVTGRKWSAGRVARILWDTYGHKFSK
jgi:hypothetical protein